MGDDGGDEAGKLHVEGELGASRDFVPSFDALDVRSDQSKIRGLFQRDVLGHRDPRGRLRELSVRRSLSAARVDHGAVVGAKRVFVDPPLSRRRFDEEGSRRRAGLPELLPRGDDARASAGQHHSETGVDVRGLRRRRFHPDPAPIGIELLGDEHRERGIDPLPHFGFVHENRDGLIRADPHEGVRGEARRRRREHPSRHSLGKIESQNEPAGHGAGSLEKPAPGMSLLARHRSTSGHAFAKAPARYYSNRFKEKNGSIGLCPSTIWDTLSPRAGPCL